MCSDTGSVVDDGLWGWKAVEKKQTHFAQISNSKGERGRFSLCNPFPTTHRLCCQAFNLYYSLDRVEERHGDPMVMSLWGYVHLSMTWIDSVVGSGEKEMVVEPDGEMGKMTLDTVPRYVQFSFNSRSILVGRFPCR